jgi:hypothetical protein
MDWDEKSIALFIDSQLLNRVETDKLVNKDGSGLTYFISLIIVTKFSAG